MSQPFSNVLFFRENVAPAVDRMQRNAMMILLPYFFAFFFNFTAQRAWLVLERIAVKVKSGITAKKTKACLSLIADTFEDTNFVFGAL